jgi:hypothetical protein
MPAHEPRSVPSVDTARTHQPGWRGCGALLELPAWPTGGYCGEPGKICAVCSDHAPAGLVAAITTAIEQWDRGERPPAAVVRELAGMFGVPIKPAPTNASIGVDVAEIDGARVVKLTLPLGADVAGLTPDVAETLARTLAQQARIARSPGGLILPPH